MDEELGGVESVSVIVVDEVSMAVSQDRFAIR